MKRSKFLALALVVAMALVGAGYALWSDVLTLNETIVMGDLDVAWTWNHTPVDGNEVFEGTPGQDYYWGKEGISEDGNKITVKIENAYPGAVIFWDGIMENLGSLPVKFEDVEVIVKQGDNFIPHLTVDYDIQTFRVGDSAWGEQKYAQDIAFDTLESKLKADLATYTLNKGDELAFGNPDEGDCITIKISEDLPNEFKKGTFEFEIVFTLLQAKP